MKLQRAMVVLGLSSCLIGSQVLSVIAQDQPVIQQEMAAEATEPTPAAEPAPAAPSDVSAPSSDTSTPAAEPSESGGGTESGNVPGSGSGTETGSEPGSGSGTETGEGEGSETGTETGEGEGSETGTETGEEEGSETGTETGEGEGSETGTETGEGEDSETGTETGEGEGSETGTETGEGEDTETGEEAGEGEDTESGEETGEGEDTESGEGEDTETGDSSQPGTSGGQQSDSSTGNSTTANPAGSGNAQKPAASVTKKKPLSLNTGKFKASNKFLDTRDKIKYNVDLPLEDIPSFITQEMIIGALKCQDETGYPASVTIAQIIQESGYGKYGPGGEEGEGLSYLAYQYNNLFGIKGTGPAGSVNMRTGEQTADGSSYSIQAGFRVYNTYTECIEDRADLLERVYKDLTFGVDDANTFAMKIGSRWATDVDYGLTLIRVMERYDLYRLDEMTLGEFSEMLGTFVNPCPGARLTSEFGYRKAPTAGASTYHKGIDLGTGEYNIPTYAAAEGTVTFAGEAGSAGMMIVIDHGDGLVTKYMHHDKIYVEEGDEVEKGQQIGLSGTTGVSTGNHLHFQVEEDGQAVDPMEYLFAEENQ